VSSWDTIKTIIDNLQAALKAVPELTDQVYSFCFPGLSVANDPTSLDVRRVILGAKSLQDLVFPQCNIILVADKIETITSAQEEHNINARIVTIHKDHTSILGGSYAALKLAYDVKDALYASLYGGRTRTLGNACNDIFVTDIQMENEPIPDQAWVHWIYQSVNIRKRF